MKKKILFFLLTVSMLTLCACGGKKTEDENTTEEEVSKQEESDKTQEEIDEEIMLDPVLYEDLTSTILSLGEYKGIEGVMETIEVSEKDIEKEIQSKKRAYAKKVEVDRPAEKWDEVLIDFTGYVDGKTSEELQGTNYPLILGSESFVPGFEEQLIGAAAGEDKKVTVTFPENYYEEMAGKEAVFDVHITNIEEYQIEGWGDDFVKENMDYESIADMETSVQNELELNAKENAEADLEYTLISKLLENCEFDIQQADVDAYVDEMMSEYQTYAKIYDMDLDTFLESQMGTTKEELEKVYQQTANFRVQMTLVFHEIAEKEKITVSDEEYQEKLKSLAEQYGYQDVSVVEKAYHKDKIIEQLIQEKVIALIVEHAKISNNF